MLIATDLVRKYGSHIAVDHVSFEVKKGSCFGLLGPNGAGKTSTIGILAGMVTPDGGSATLDGQAIHPDANAVKAKVGYVPQELAVYEEISAMANLEFFAALYGLGGAERRKRIDRVLELTSLTDRSSEPVAKFSGGMKRRLNIAASLMHEPELLILDEPTVGVDPQSRNAIFDALERLMADGLTILYTSHYMEEVERLCDHIVIMDNGRVVTQGRTVELLNSVSSQSVSVELASPEDAQVIQSRFGARGFAVAQKGNAVEIQSSDIASVLKILVTDCPDVIVSGIQSQRTSLEEVFLSLTGKSLRD